MLIGLLRETSFGYIQYSYLSAPISQLIIACRENCRTVNAHHITMVKSTASTSPFSAHTLQPCAIRVWALLADFLSLSHQYTDRVRPSAKLGSAALQLEESTVLLQLGEQRVAMGASGRHRHGQTESLHEPVPRSERWGRPGQGCYRRQHGGQDPSCASAGEAQW